jgi:flagellar biosynthesis chaperone FliJ
VSPFHFSLKKLHRFQNQKKRLAEIQTMLCKSKFDAAVNHLRLLNEQFLTLSSNRDIQLARNAALAISHRRHLDTLRNEIAVAQEKTDRAELEWQQAVEYGHQVNARLEGYNMIYQTEKSEYMTEVAKSEANELLDTVMKQWQDQQGETSNG